MRRGRRVKDDYEYSGDILLIRAVEDSIRVTRNYTEGIKTMRQKHPIQGEEFPSRAFCKHYEVYPDVELSWDMSASVAWAWVWGDIRHIDVVFNYDYRGNKASVIIAEGPTAVKELANAIPNFSDALARVVADGNSEA